MNLSIVQFRENMADPINRVTYAGERVILRRRGKGVAALVSMEDLARLEGMEDQRLTEEALAEERRAKAAGEKPIPFEKVERELNARKPRRGRRA
jgi:prevent-host-death family protein